MAGPPAAAHPDGRSSAVARAGEDAAYFTPGGYAGVIRRALGRGYRVTGFRGFAPPAGRPVLLLRHDLDHDLASALTLAEIEAAAGVSATYFVQIACAFYNLLAPDGRAVLRRLTDLGHEVGLHYEARRYLGAGGRAVLEADLRLLEDLAGAPVVSAAQHIPIDDGVVNLGPRVANEAYEARFTEAPMAYVSDSLMAWRQATPHDLLDADRSFQFLTHPETWLGGAERIGEALDRCLAAEVAALRERYASTLAYYDRLLAERAERDRAFRARRRAGTPGTSAG